MYGYATAIYRLYTGYSPTMRQLYHRQWWLQVPGERIKILLQTQGQGGAPLKYTGTWDCIKKVQRCNNRNATCCSGLPHGSRPKRASRADHGMGCYRRVRTHYNMRCNTGLGRGGRRAWTVQGVGAHADARRPRVCRVLRRVRNPQVEARARRQAWPHACPGPSAPALGPSRLPWALRACPGPSAPALGPPRLPGDLALAPLSWPAYDITHVRDATHRVVTQRSVFVRCCIATHRVATE